MYRTVLAALAAAVAATSSFAYRPQTPVEAGVAVRMDVTQLVDAAGLVLEGRVIGQRAVLAPNGRIDTEYTLDVARTFWGEPVGQRTVRIPGGVLPDGRGMLVPGMASLVPGEEVILMLSEAGPSGVCMPMGLSQGKYTVTTDRLGARVAVRRQASLDLVQPATGAVRPADQVEVVEYAELIAQLEVAVVARRARTEEK